MNYQIVLISMFVYLLLNQFVPKIIKKPTGIEPLDNLVMLLISEQQSVMTGILLTGIINALTQYIIEF
jgi:hypothetical protein